MPRKDDSQNIKDALQAKDIELLQKSIENLNTTMIEGFKGIHLRQDTTNGKVLNNQSGITTLTAKFQYNRIIWYLLTTAVSVIIALGSYILFNH